MEYIKTGDTIILRLIKGEEIIDSLKSLQRAEKIRAAAFAGIGAADNAVIGVYKVGEKRYVSSRLSGEMEIAALNGNISVAADGGEYIHAHIVLGDGNRAYAGHLNEAYVSATAEIFVKVFPDTEVGRVYDPDTGLNVFKLK